MAPTNQRARWSQFSRVTGWSGHRSDSGQAMSRKHRTRSVAVIERNSQKRPLSLEEGARFGKTDEYQTDLRNFSLAEM